jgi:hypothetical protein
MMCEILREISRYVVEKHVKQIRQSNGCNPDTCSKVFVYMTREIEQSLQYLKGN